MRGRSFSSGLPFLSHWMISSSDSPVRLLQKVNKGPFEYRKWVRLRDVFWKIHSFTREHVLVPVHLKRSVESCRRKDCVTSSGLVTVCLPFSHGQSDLVLV